MQLPALLSKVLDEIGPGAIIKNVDDDSRAIVIDMVERGLNVAPVCARVKPEIVAQEKLPSRARHYELFTLKEDFDQWIVLDKGQDELLLIE